MNQGKVLEVVGARVDLDFSGAELPDILNAVEVDRADGTKLVLEVQQHISASTGNRFTRFLCMDTRPRHRIVQRRRALRPHCATVTLHGGGRAPRSFANSQRDRVSA